MFITQPGQAGTVFVDPGHGGDDNGAVSGNANVEKQFTLALARKIAHLLTPVHRVEMSRKSDVTLSITERAAMANHYKADLMVSLHAAVAPYCSERKAAVFYHKDDRLVFPPGLTLHDQTNESDADRPAWIKLQSRHHHQSKHLATLIKQGLRDSGVCDQISVNGAPLAALMGADLPAVLIEVGCLYPSTKISASTASQLIDQYAKSIANAIERAMTGL